LGAHLEHHRDAHGREHRSHPEHLVGDHLGELLDLLDVLAKQAWFLD
jgi:hypothetical protein